MSKRKNVLANIIISLIIGVLLGALIVLLAGILDVSFLIKWGLIVIGIIVIISNIPTLVNGIMSITKMEGVFDVIFSGCGIALGLCMIFLQGTVMTIIVSAYLIVLPIIRILLSGKGGWKDQIKKEWLKMLIGVLLLAFLPGLVSAVDTVVKMIILIAGWAVIGISVLLFLLSLISYLLSMKKAQDNAHIETTAEDVSEN